MNNRKHGQGTHCNKMGADSSAQNTPNAPQFICPIYLPKPKRLGPSMKKRFNWESVVRRHNIQYFQHWPSKIFIILWVCTFKVGTYHLFMQVMTKTYDRTLGSYSGLMVELLKAL